MKNLLKTKISRMLFVVACTLGGCVLAYVLQITNPMIILISLMIAFTVLMGQKEGALSGLVLLAYGWYFFSTNHDLQTFTVDNGGKLLVVFVALGINYLLVSALKGWGLRDRHLLKESNQALQKANAALKRANAKLAERSDRDELTGIYNRRGGDRYMKKYLQQEDARPAVLAALDIDDFKHFNDVYGHALGDRVLASLVDSMKIVFGEAAIFIRNGGDEFQIFFPDKKPQEVQESLEAFGLHQFTVAYQGEKIGYRISLGYSCYPAQASTISELCQEADAALYYVKMNGKHGAAMYDPAMNKRHRSQLGFNLMDISAGIPVAILVYRADETEEILFATQSLLNLFECRNLDEFLQYTAGTFRNIVHPDDLEEVEAEIKRQVKNNDDHLDMVEYRIITQKGKIRHIHDIGHLVTSPYYGDVFYVILYEKEIIRRS